MGMEETALELIGLTYDATLAPEKWPAFMERFVKAMGARSGLLREVDHVTGAVPLFETVGYDPAYVAAYREHFVHLDYFNPALINMPIGIVLKGNTAVPWERQRKSEFYNDYLLPQNIHHTMGCFLARDDRHHLLFALQREQMQGDFDEEDLRLVRLVTPHMARSVQIQRRMMATVTSQKHWTWSVLDRLRVGVILLNEQGRPVHLNRAAERLVAGGSGFAAGRGGLTLSSPSETAHLQRLIAAAASLAIGRDSTAGGCLRATGNGATTLQFQVIPLPQGLSERPWEQSLPGGCVAVFVSPSGGPHLSWSRLVAMHGITRAEARLASLLADGSSLEEAADVLSISIQTARSQLKSVFAKTGVKRQAELVALLLTDMLSDQTDDPLTIDS